jgi:hypothetical protein
MSEISRGRLLSLAAAFGLVMCLAGSGCGTNKSENPEPKPASPKTPAAWIKAEPNPVPVPGTEPGITTISWDTGDTSNAQVYLLTGDQKETLFAGGPKGSQKVDWIGPGTKCDFLLYAGTERQKELARVTVTTTK